MKSCTNEELGRLITRYEMGDLTEQEQDLFEEHLMDCGYCAREIHEMIPIMTVMRDDKEEIITALEEKGIQSEGEKKKLTAAHTGVSSVKGFWHEIIHLIDVIIKPKVYVPALATIMLFIFGYYKILPHQNPYLPYLTFEKLDYSSGMRGGELISDPQRWFYLGINQYLLNQLDSAIVCFEKATKAAPDSGAWWLYLGISYYIDSQPGEAINSLNHAYQKSSGKRKDDAQWYLAQAQLLGNRKNEAIPLLEEIVEQAGFYAPHAEKLLHAIRRTESGAK